MSCVLQALSRKQMKRPSKLYTTGSARTGFSMYVRALSSESREADWVQRFVTVAATDPALLRNEGSDTQSQNLATGSDEEIRAAAARSMASKQRNQQVNGKLRSMSFSDSAHSSQQRKSAPAANLRTGQSLNISRQVVAQYADEALDTSPRTSGSMKDEDSAYAPAELYHVTQDCASSSSALPVPLHNSGATALHTAPPLQQGPQAGSGYMEPVVEVNEDGSLHSSYGAEPGQPALPQAPAWQRALDAEQRRQAGDSTKVITTPWANGIGQREEWAHMETIPFISADDSLKRHWRTIALQGIEDEESASEKSVSESQHPATASPSQTHWDTPEPLWDASQTGLVFPVGQAGPPPQTHTYKSSSPPQEPYSSHFNPSYDQGTPHFSNTPTIPAQNADYCTQCSVQEVPLAQTDPTDVSKTHTGQAVSPPECKQVSLEPAVQQQSEHSGAQQPSSSPVSLVSFSENTGFHSSPQLPPTPRQPSGLVSQDGHLDYSDLEAVRQRSIALDIPSAELLDSILEFANNCCGPSADDTLASLPLESFGRNGSSNLTGSGWQHHAHPQNGPSTPPHHTHGTQPGLSHASCSSSVEPFSDDDDVTVLDTTEIIKKTYPPNALTQHISTEHWSPQSVHTPRLPPYQPPALQPTSPVSPSLHSLHSDGYSLVDASHPDAATDLVFEINPGNSHNCAQHPSDSRHAPPHILYNPGPPKPAETIQSDQRYYTVYDSDPHLLTTIPEYDGRSQHLSTGSSHSKYVDGDYLSHSSSKSPSLLHPNEFRDMVDQLIASGEHQAAQSQASHVSVSGGAEQLHSSGGMHPIWEDEEDCHIQGMPCKVTIGGLATV